MRVRAIVGSDFSGQPALRATLRGLCTPGNLLLAGVLVLGWLALIGWTGAGADGWQARLCADLDLQPRVCQAVRVTEGRGPAPTFASVGAAS